MQGAAHVLDKLFVKTIPAPTTLYPLADMMILLVKIPQGAKVVPVPPKYSVEADEMEVLLPHNAKFQITDLTFGGYSKSHDERDLQTLYVKLIR